MTTQLNMAARDPEGLFQDTINLENFYCGAGRGELLEKMKGALGSAVSLMVLSGEEGSGKTMMCRMLESECPPTIVVVSFPHTVESFEDVVKRIADRLGLQATAAEAGRSVEEVIEQIISHLSKNSQGLLAVFDEAEDLYLATLERIRKMLDRVTAGGVSMQILFSGRKIFLDNCAQLSLCDFRNTEEIHFELLPLTEKETAEYLHQAIYGLHSPDKLKIFNDEVVRNIHGLAKGKFRRIKLLAEQTLRSQGNDTSFMVLLESVKDEAGTEVDDDEPVPFGFRRFVPYLWWVGGVLGTLLLLVFFLQPGEERQAAKPVVLPPVVSKLQKAPGEQAQPEKQNAASEPAAATVVLPPVEQPQVPVDQQPVTVEQIINDKADTGVEATTEALGPVETLDTAEEKPQSKTGLPADQESNPAAVRGVLPEKPVAAGEDKIPHLRQASPVKVKKEIRKGGTAEAAKTPASAGKQEVVGTVGHLTVDQLYQNRLNAGSSWAKGEKGEMFTVQLMVLTAKNAELNLKKMLVQPNYRQEAGNFFIFKKNGSPEVVLVFYGEYPSMEIARLAQNSLPKFLRDHQPYAVSIKGAMAKVKK